MQRVCRAVQGIADRRGVSAVFNRVEEVVDDRQVAARLLGEDLVQHGIHLEPGLRRRDRLARELRRHGVALGECDGLGGQQTDVDVGLLAHFKLFDEFGYGRRRFTHKFDHGRRHGQRAVDDAVQQILDVPAVFANALGAHHAATALERVERPAHGDQRIDVARVVLPLRQ